MNSLERSLWVVFAIILGMGVYWGFEEPQFFTDDFMREDGLVEYATVALLLAGCVLTIVRWLKHRAASGWTFTLISWLIILGFFFVAGEELSWGQRIFDLQTTEYFKKNNAQEELNLHNLTVGGVKINKLVFGLILTTVIMIYIVLVPILYWKVSWIRKKLDDWYIPIPQWWQSAGYLVLTLLISIIPASKNWELLEFGSVMVFFLILLNPRNKQVMESSPNL